MGWVRGLLLAVESEPVPVIRVGSVPTMLADWVCSCPNGVRVPDLDKSQQGASG